LNNKGETVADVLREEIYTGSQLSVISSYFTIYVFAALQKELNKIDSMRFIFTEPSFINKEKELIREYYIDSNAEQKIFGNKYEIRLRNEMKQANIAKEFADWLMKKTEIRSYKRVNEASVKLIHINNGSEAVSITGSVDFTTSGLGISPSDRTDIIPCFFDEASNQSTLKMFDDIWADKEALEDIKAKVLEQMQVLYKENTPEFIYFVTLYNIFHEYLDELSEESIVKSKTGIKETVIWNKLYKFQRDGVIGAIEKIEKHNGCIIADSVGLGKTFTALAIIKYYELRNDRVLLLVPKRLNENWTIYTQNDKRNILIDDKFRYDVLHHTDLSRTSGRSGNINLATINWGNYDLVVIDESHNFRNNNPAKGRISRYERMMKEIIKSGVKTKVLMLSATPVNNRMNDIKNQIAFITADNSKALADVGIKDIDNTLKNAQTNYNIWVDKDDIAKTTETFVNMMDADYFKLLDTLTIARSRKHIEKYYNLAELGDFPERLPPVNKYPEIDIQGKFPRIGEINLQIKRLILCYYSPLKYLLPGKEEEYEQKYDLELEDGKSIFKQRDRETSIIGLMRVNILKRMESSISSFKLTIERIVNKISDIIERIDEGQIEYNPELFINEIDLDDDELESLLFGNNVKVLLQDMDLQKWRYDLQYDENNLRAILEEAKKVTPERDAKLIELRSLIEEKVNNPLNENNKKVLIFTAFAETAAYLYNNLHQEYKEKSIYMALVTGSDGNYTTLPIAREDRSTIKISDINTVLTLFSPKSKECKKIYPNQKDFIDILIATDCVSEGQNLQDCDCVINYDIHWNPVRIIQRFGRIDRIGSENKVIQLVNFWPTKDLDEYINLQQRVKGRSTMVSVSATGEDNMIDDRGGQDMKDLDYRKKQLNTLQSRVVNLEEISGGISITDLTYNDFKIDLMNYLKENKKKLANAPAGMYAIAQIDDALKEQIEPGVIFTLRQIADKAQENEQNPLFPYFMIYITDKGKVSLSFLEAKQILDIYKKLCSGKNEVLQDFVETFNKETKDGKKMSFYSDLLRSAIESMNEKKQEIGIASLFRKGGTYLSPKEIEGLKDFELISFLVVKE